MKSVNRDSKMRQEYIQKQGGSQTGRNEIIYKLLFCSYGNSKSNQADNS